MATNTRTQLGARSDEHTTATARAGLVSAAETTTALLPVLAVLAAIALGFSNPGLAFVLFGMPAAVVLGVALVFGVVRAGAAVASRV